MNLRIFFCSRNVELMITGYGDRMKMQEVAFIRIALPLVRTIELNTHRAPQI